MDMRKHIGKKDMGSILEEMDQDKDGKVSLDELLRDMDSWSDGDENDQKEANFREELEIAKFKAADKGNDGQLDAEEMTGYLYPETDPEVLKLVAEAAIKNKDLN